MEVDHILALVGSENTGLPLSQRRELALQIWRAGEVVSTLDGVTLYKRLGKISDILYLNNKNNQLERRVQPPKDIH